MPTYYPYQFRKTPKGIRIIEPIREIEKISAMKDALIHSTIYNPERNLFMFQLGINTGLRISDILWIRAVDLRSKSHLITRELKTGKRRMFLINEHFRPVVDSYIDGMADYDYIFPTNRFGNMPITRNHAYRILRTAAEQVGLDHIGTHSMRKTFGYHHYRIHKDIQLLMMIFNHQFEADTLRYIGWSQQLMDESVRDFYL
ncbi:site-specific tyrosine recombinase XerC [compost metagenome]